MENLTAGAHQWRMASVSSEKRAAESHLVAVFKEHKGSGCSKLTLLFFLKREVSAVSYLCKATSADSYVSRRMQCETIIITVSGAIKFY